MAMALGGLGLLGGLPGGGFSETAVLASTGMALLSAAGFAAVTHRAGGLRLTPLRHRRPCQAQALNCTPIQYQAARFP
jgi:hypothetical protein